MTHEHRTLSAGHGTEQEPRPGPRRAAGYRLPVQPARRGVGERRRARQRHRAFDQDGSEGLRRTGEDRGTGADAICQASQDAGRPPGRKPVQGDPVTMKEDVGKGVSESHPLWARGCQADTRKKVLTKGKDFQPSLCPGRGAPCFPGTLAGKGELLPALAERFAVQRCRGGTAGRVQPGQRHATGVTVAAPERRAPPRSYWSTVRVAAGACPATPRARTSQSTTVTPGTLAAFVRTGNQGDNAR